MRDRAPSPCGLLVSPRGRPRPCAVGEPAPSPAVAGPWYDRGRRAGRADRGRGRGARRPDLGRRRAAAGRQRQRRGPRLRPGGRDLDDRADAAGRASIIRRWCRRRRPGPARRLRRRRDGPTAAVRRLDDGATAWADGVPLPERARRRRGRVRRQADRLRRRRRAGRRRERGLRAATGDGRGRRIGRLPTAREHLAATSDGAGRTFVLGGRVGGLDSNLAHRRRRRGRRRSRTIGDLPTPRGGVAAFWWPSLGACLAGGESPGGTNPQVECIDRRRHARATARPRRRAPRRRRAVVDGTAYVVLGGRQPGLFTSDVTEALAAALTLSSGTARPGATPRSSGCGGGRRGREPRREALADEDRVVEVDELDVARRGRADRLDQRPRGGPVVRREPPVRAPACTGSRRRGSGGCRRRGRPRGSAWPAMLPPCSQLDVADRRRGRGPSPRRPSPPPRAGRSPRPSPSSPCRCRRCSRTGWSR